jgi:hypothetical protein
LGIFTKEKHPLDLSKKDIKTTNKRVSIASEKTNDNDFVYKAENGDMIIDFAKHKFTTDYLRFKRITKDGQLVTISYSGEEQFQRWINIHTIDVYSLNNQEVIQAVGNFERALNSIDTGGIMWFHLPFDAHEDMELLKEKRQRAETLDEKEYLTQFIEEFIEAEKKYSSREFYLILTEPTLEELRIVERNIHGKISELGYDFVGPEKMERILKKLMDLAVKEF